jgi:hypothetical protein
MRHPIIETRLHFLSLPFFKGESEGISELKNPPESPFRKGGLSFKSVVLSAVLIFLIIASSIACAWAAEQEKWPGVDEAVIKKFARDAGREAREPFISMGGDMMLFAFLIAGAAGGFIAGYYFRSIFPPSIKSESEGDKDV